MFSSNKVCELGVSKLSAGMGAGDGRSMQERTARVVCSTENPCCWALFSIAVGYLWQHAQVWQVKSMSVLTLLNFVCIYMLITDFCWGTMGTISFSSWPQNLAYKNPKSCKPNFIWCQMQYSTNPFRACSNYMHLTSLHCHQEATHALPTVLWTRMQCSGLKASWLIFCHPCVDMSILTHPSA